MLAQEIQIVVSEGRVINGFDDDQTNKCGEQTQVLEHMVQILCVMA